MVTVHREGNLELRANSINTRDENGSAISLEVRPVESAERPDVRQHIAAECRVHPLPDAPYEFLTGFDIDTGILVGLCLLHRGISCEDTRFSEGEHDERTGLVDYL
jgi:hypothetical protein